MGLQVAIIFIGKSPLHVVNEGLTENQWGSCIGLNAITFVVSFLVKLLPIHICIDKFLESKMKNEEDEEEVENNENNKRNKDNDEIEDFKQIKFDNGNSEKMKIKMGKNNNKNNCQEDNNDSLILSEHNGVAGNTDQVIISQVGRK